MLLFGTVHTPPPVITILITVRDCADRCGRGEVRIGDGIDHRLIRIAEGDQVGFGGVLVGIVNTDAAQLETLNTRRMENRNIECMLARNPARNFIGLASTAGPTREPPRCSFR